MKLAASRLAVALAILCRSPAGASPAEEKLAGPPDWLQQHMAYLVGGTWHTDNQAHQSEQEPADAYEVRYEWSVGQRSVRGRLYGMRQGREVATYWEYRLFWHPEQRQAVFQQFGFGGVVGIGHTQPSAPKQLRTEQRFLAPGAGPRESAHDWTEDGPNRHTTVSWEREGSAWKKGRTYTWERIGDPPPRTGEAWSVNRPERGRFETRDLTPPQRRCR